MWLGNRLIFIIQILSGTVPYENIQELYDDETPECPNDVIHREDEEVGRQVDEQHRVEQGVDPQVEGEEQVDRASGTFPHLVVQLAMEPDL